jgi:hypothetical protein
MCFVHFLNITRPDIFDYKQVADSINREPIKRRALYFYTVEQFKIQCPLFNRITLDEHKSDNNNQMIQLTLVFCLLFRYNGTSNI